MKNRVKFGDLRRLLLEMGFHETSGQALIFRHEPSDTLFVFRPYQQGDPVASYNLIEVKTMLDSRGLMPAEAFENQFRKAPA